MTAPTPRPHAERAPEGEVTAAVERLWRPADDFPPAVQRAAASMYIPASPADGAREWLHGWQLNAAQSALAAALGVEEMAGVLASHAGWRSYGQHGYGLECSCGTDLGEHSMAVNANDVHQRHQAAALRAAILGGAA